ncbi:hypothetical protein [Neobacillus sp. LXY-4]|uniref:hypothetical protein n=1 Tax=Neobacillus sp. LXY-4 TaxID=3379826 RepID=UPI003EE0011C
MNLLNIIFIVLFILGIIYLLSYRLNLKKATEIAKDAIFPRQKEEFARVLIPIEWKEMRPLTKSTRSYQTVKWGTVAVIILFSVVLWMVFATEWLESAFLEVIYLFCAIISAVHHPGNFYILPNGVILNGRYFSFNKIKSYEAEKIVRWHDLYGLDSRVNNAYKLTINVKKSFVQPKFVVVEDQVYLEKIISLLEQQGIEGIQKIRSEVNDSRKTQG